MRDVKVRNHFKLFGAFLVMGLVGIANQALADNDPMVTYGPPTTPTGPSVPIDQTELHFKGALDFESHSIFQDSRIELGVSSWMPRNLQAYSFQGFTDSFSADGLPSLSIGYLFSPVKTGFWHDLSVRIGAGYLRVGRTETLDMDEFAGETYEQQVNLVSMNIGAELSPSAWRWKALAPYLGVGFLPTLAYTSRTVFDDSSSSFSVPLQLTIGVNCELPEFWIFSGRNRAAVDLGGVSTIGSISGSQVVSAGVQGGLRLSM